MDSYQRYPKEFADVIKTQFLQTGGEVTEEEVTPELIETIMTKIDAVVKELSALENAAEEDAGAGAAASARLATSSERMATDHASGRRDDCDGLSPGASDDESGRREDDEGLSQGSAAATHGSGGTEKKMAEKHPVKSKVSATSGGGGGDESGWDLEGDYNSNGDY